MPEMLGRASRQIGHDFSRALAQEAVGFSACDILRSVKQMNQQSVRVEIFDQTYNLRGTDAEYITRLAEYVDAKIRTIAQQTATVDSVRLAVLAAINIADELHIVKRQHDSVSCDYRSRAKDLFGALDAVLEPARLAG
jgi:cell division protein ZapA